ncbi:hypothetical protein C7B65_25020 [Phormidesmis priestleyi ULC007]|uniref:Uncharacterized protein n=1 Tax=Phormidesmis priestleyi ULC007 TaxID=1920490 RepID=A0A2T1D3Y0_9CYAN|nr:hypothetical protein [Phormidesmis priestleyi]PSB15188.1 hypothetical protein C7B65_25020 [Phormidesmis priestleyi ULC007]PZO46022.1 MAG: hypothetical protein DCF14_23975 [Phormidesmis priestleyi]
MYSSYLGLSFGFVTLLLLLFGGLHWLQIPTGSFVDWAIAAASFGWLLAIVTIPWNIYFDAKEALAEAALSDEKGIPVDQRQVDYIRVVAERSGWVVIALHILSAIGLYGLAAAGISQVGYVSSGAALLLTVLRPAVRTYQYFATRIATLRQQFQYPREDVVELRSRFQQLEATVERLASQLNPDDPSSWVATQQRQSDAIRQDLTHVAASQENLRSTNQAEHDRLSREAKQAIAQLTTDGQFLDHVREIIRFFKTA